MGGKETPEDIRKASEHICQAYGIRGICDPKYIANIIQRQLLESRQEFKESSRDDPLGYSAIDVSSIYRITGVVGDIATMEISLIDYSAGGNGDHSLPVIINWDLKSDKLLTSDDLFCSKDYISTLMPLVREKIIKKLSAKYPEEPLSQGIIDWINRGTEIDSGYWDSFLLVNNGLIVPRPEGVLATYHYGILPYFGFNSENSYISGFNAGYIGS